MIQAAQLQMFKTAAKAPEGKRPAGEKADNFSSVLNQTLVGTDGGSSAAPMEKPAEKEAPVSEDGKNDGTGQTDLQAFLGQTGVPAMMYLYSPVTQPAAKDTQSETTSGVCAPAIPADISAVSADVSKQAAVGNVSENLRPAAADPKPQAITSAEDGANASVRTEFQELVRAAGAEPLAAQISVSSDPSAELRSIPAEQRSTFTVTAESDAAKAGVQSKGAEISAAAQDSTTKQPEQYQAKEHSVYARTATQPVRTVKPEPGSPEKMGETVVADKPRGERLRPEETMVSAVHQKVEAGTGTAIYTEAAVKTERQPVSQTDQVFAQVAQKAVQTVRENGSGDYVFDMKLFPEGLGKVEVRMVCKGDVLSLTVTAHQGEAGRLLSDQTEQLKAALSEHYQVTELNIRTDVRTEISDTMAFLNGGFSMARHDGGGQFSGGLHPYTGQEPEPETDEAEEIRMGILNAKV